MLRASLPLGSELDRRDFAWHYLWGQCQGALKQQGSEQDFTVSHAGPVTSLAFSEDGQRVASGGGGTVRLWDLATNAIVAEKTDFGKQVKAVAFSADGSIVVSTPGALRVWRMEDNSSEQFPNPGRDIRCIALSPDSSLLASGHGIGVVKVWNISNKKRMRTLAGHNRPVNSIAFSPDGETLASADRADGIILWNIDEGKRVATFVGDTMAFSGDGRILAAVGSSRSIQLWDISDTRQPKALPGHKVRGFVRDIAFTKDNYLVIMYKANKWEVLDVSRGDFVGDLKGDVGKWTATAISSDATRVASASHDEHENDGKANQVPTEVNSTQVNIWQVNVDDRRESPGKTTDWVTSVTLDAQGRSVSVVNGKFAAPFATVGGVARRFMIENGTSESLLGEQPNALNAEHWLCVTSSPDESLIACGGFRCLSGTDKSVGVVALRPTQAGSLTPTYLPHGDEWVRSTAFAPDGKLLAVGSRCGPVALWDVSDWKNPTILEQFDTPAFDLKFSPDGRILAAGGGHWSYGKINLIDVGTRRIVANRNEPAGSVTSLVFFPDGRTLVAADYGGNITFYDTKLQELRKVLAHNMPIRDIVTTNPSRPEDLLIVSGGEGGAVKLWHAATGTELGRLSNDMPVYSLSFSKDGNSLAAGLGDGSVKLWRTNDVDRVFGRD